MRYFLIFLLLTLSAVGALAQNPSDADYIYPVRGVQRLYSANFGELRSNHFHSGIDIKTDGVTGKRIVAVADGYISRIVVQPSGYGRALYITHDDGTTSVYGHLELFRDDIEAYVRAERLRRRSNRVDLYFGRERWRVAQGDFIALSGNTGQSFGPHLHFEIRESASQRTLNLFRCGYVTPDDDIPPIIARLHYVEVDTLQGVPVHSPRCSYSVAATAERGIYRLADTVEVGRNGFFEVEVTDRKNGVTNKFGLYRVGYSVDNQIRMEYCMDGFTFDRSRYCNAVSSYELQLDSPNEALRLARLDGCPSLFYTHLIDDGLFTTDAGQEYSVALYAEDDMGNISRMEFVARGVDDAESFVADGGVVTEEVVHRRSEFRHIDSIVDVTIPADALYESTFYRGRSGLQLPKVDTSLVVLSPRCSIFDVKTPLHKSATLYIACDVPEHLRSKAVLARVNHRGKVVSAGGRYLDGRVGGKISSLGDYLVVADVTPPSVKPRFRVDADLSRDSYLSFNVSDNFSGIATYEGSIDGEWAIFEYMPVAGRLIHYFRDSNLAKGSHVARIKVRDGCGNERIVERRFYR